MVISEFIEKPDFTCRVRTLRPAQAGTQHARRSILDNSILTDMFRHSNKNQSPVKYQDAGFRLKTCRDNGSHNKLREIRPKGIQTESTRRKPVGMESYNPLASDSSTSTHPEVFHAAPSAPYQTQLILT